MLKIFDENKVAHDIKKIVYTELGGDTPILHNIIKIYNGAKLVWSALQDIVNCCFSAGYWINEYPWKNDEPWKNGNN